MPLELSPEDFALLADRVCRAASEYLANLDGRASFPATSGAATAGALDRPLPEQGVGSAAFDDLAVIADHSRPGNARFFAYVLGSGEPVAAIGDLYASVLNQNVTAWRPGPAAVTVERTVLRWLAEAIGCEGFTGSLVGGGSSANLMGLAMAREARVPANQDGARPCAVYASAEVHMSVPKALAVLGVGRANLRLIPVDEAFRMRTDALAAAIERDRGTGIPAIAVVATAGTTSTGAVDPLREIAGIAQASGLWLHVDGAYGALAAMAAPELFAGLAEADSISLDAHKWLYQPLDCSALLYSDAGAAPLPSPASTPGACPTTRSRALRSSRSPSSCLAGSGRSSSGCRCAITASANFAPRSAATSNMRNCWPGSSRPSPRWSCWHRSSSARCASAGRTLRGWSWIGVTPRSCARYSVAGASTCPTPASTALSPFAPAS